MVSGVNSGTGNRHKVEMRTTRTAIGGISVARRFYRKMYTRSATGTTTIMHMRLVLCPAGAISRHSMKEHEVRDYGKRPMHKKAGGKTETRSERKNLRKERRLISERPTFFKGEAESFCQLLTFNY